MKPSTDKPATAEEMFETDPVKKTQRRHKLARDLANEILSEYRCQRTATSRLGDKFEGLKTRLRFRFNEDELAELAMLSALAVLEAGSLVTVTGKRLGVVPRTNSTNHLRDTRQ